MVVSVPCDGVTVYTPRTPVKAEGFHDDQLPYLVPLIRQIADEHPDHIAWFYTPMALPLLNELNPQLVVYDCMDELAAFRNPPKQLLQRENGLFKEADIVFTGGPSLFRAKQERHPNVHCFPSSVDVSHFSRALDRGLSHPAHDRIPKPRLGYYGVIDERLDLGLIAQLADSHPEWQLMLVGPIVKIDKTDLPRRENIHYVGQQRYEELPRILAGWDICLLPFARNESTRFISPTKTLEYLAASLPVVSTDIADVVELYGGAVSIASTPEDFVSACEKSLGESLDERSQKVKAAEHILSSGSWDKTAEKMQELLSTLPMRAGVSRHLSKEPAWASRARR
jgi:glycosyltransferase involved in cell wall biosynthesis